MKNAFVAALLAMMLAAVPATAQETPNDPNCEEDPTQMGCDTACADPTVDCEHPPCPTSLAGKVEQDGSVFMSWTVNALSDVRVYRSTDGGPAEPIAYLDFPATRFLDNDTKPGETYVYSVAHVGMDQEVDDGPAEGESSRCGHLEVSAIPFFPTTAGLLLAVASIAMVAVVARRR